MRGWASTARVVAQQLRRVPPGIMHRTSGQSVREVLLAAMPRLLAPPTPCTMHSKHQMAGHTARDTRLRRLQGSPLTAPAIPYITLGKRHMQRATTQATQQAVPNSWLHRIATKRTMHSKCHREWATTQATQQAAVPNSWPHRIATRRNMHSRCHREWATTQGTLPRAMLGVQLWGPGPACTQHSRHHQAWGPTPDLALSATQLILRSTAGASGRIQRPPKGPVRRASSPLPKFQPST